MFSSSQNKVFQLINYLCNIPMFAICVALYDKRKVGCHTLNDHGNSMVGHEIIMEKSWNFILYFLWEPCLQLGNKFCRTCEVFLYCLIWRK